MKYVFRNARPEDFEKLLAASTENGKVDEEVIRTSVETKVMECDGEPIMMIGRIEYPTGDLIMTTGVWAIVSKDIGRHTRKAVQFCKDLIFDRIGFKFLVLIDETNPKFARFAEFFGFQRTNFVEEKLGTVYHLYIKET
jgi:hypothetical protein